MAKNTLINKSPFLLYIKDCTDSASWVFPDGIGCPLYAGDGVVPRLSVTRLTPHFHHSSDYHGKSCGGVHVRQCGWKFRACV